MFRGPAFILLEIYTFIAGGLSPEVERLEKAICFLIKDAIKFFTVQGSLEKASRRIKQLNYGMVKDLKGKESRASNTNIL